jgi:hypothetical protein
VRGMAARVRRGRTRFPDMRGTEAWRVLGASTGSA